MAIDRNDVHGIVVGYDGSPGARLALDWAVETARRDDRDLTIVHALGLTTAATVSAYDSGPAARLYEEMTEAIVTEGVARAAKELEHARIHAASVVGSPAAELVAASRHADLVVTGSRGRGEAASGLLGSTAYAVAAHAHCPVVVVRGNEVVHAGANHPVVVGVDSSDSAARALDAAAMMAGAAEASLYVVAVDDVAASAGAWSMEPALGYGYVVPSVWVDDVAKQAHAATTRLVEDLATRVRGAHPGLDVHAVALDGAPGQSIAQQAREVDAGLVVVGSRGHGGFTGMLLGSVSHRVVHDSPCPVMVIH